MKRCFGYTRVSSQKQGEGVSLHAQKEAITEYAKQNGMIVSEWYEEKETAARSGRPVFNRMIRDLKRGRAEGLITHRIDRSTRNFRDWAAIGELSDAGIDVHFATESLDFRSRGGRLVADIQVAVAADYCRNLSIEARKGINGRLKQGFYPFPAPIGYQDNGGGALKTFDPARAPLVRTLFQLYLTGDHSIRSLHQEMRRIGLTTRRGKLISRRNIEQILQNPFYCGLTRNGRSGEVFQGKHEPLISSRQFQRVADIKAGRYTKKSTRHNHLFRRLFFCSNCGELMTGEVQKRRYVYYRCHTPGCPSLTVREEVIDVAVRRALGALQFSDADVATMRQHFETWDAPARLKENKKALELRLADAKARLDQLTDFLLEGTIDKVTYVERRSRTMEEINGLEGDAADLGKTAISEHEIERFFERMKTLKNLYILANPDEKRRIVENCFSNCVWNGKNVELEPSDLVLQAKSGAVAPYGGGTRDTFRTFIKLFDAKTNC